MTEAKKISKNVGATAHYDNVVVLASSLDALHFDQIERYFTAPVPLDQSGTGCALLLGGKRIDVSVRRKKRL